MCSVIRMCSPSTLRPPEAEIVWAPMSYEIGIEHILVREHILGWAPMSYRLRAYVCMHRYVYVCICIHIYMYVCMYIRTYIRMHACMYVCIYNIFIIYICYIHTYKHVRWAAIPYRLRVYTRQ